MSPRTSPGKPYPLGATVTPDGINFALFSRNGTAVYLELFDADDPAPRASLALDPRRDRTGDIWHLFVHGIGAGQQYGYRVDGPYTPSPAGHRFNVNKLLFDPYARAFAGRYATEHDSLYGYDRSVGSAERDLSFSSADSATHTTRSVALSSSTFDWEDDQPPRRSLERSTLYEVHVKGFTTHPSAAVAHPGTYLGLVEKIPHLLDLGVTAVELMPTHEFDPDEHNGTDPLTGRLLGNYWGYSPLGFFGLQRRYAATPTDPASVAREFREMVKALHLAGIEVILDVVFNHTGEGDEIGPTLGFRGLDNAVYYMLDRGRFYRNYSGCGNTLNCNHTVVKQLILDCLRYWAVEMHVDGFRFDLATILGRDRKGAWIGDLGLLYDIGGDPILRGCKLIAESWDAEGMYKVGGFPASWAEWNGRFRDDVRRFVRGDRGMVPDLARRIGGSRDLFGQKRTPAHSINFITAHDGFTLRDLVSYEHKHNERNGEQNRDGTDASYSCNHGAEGPTDDPSIRSLRLTQAKNLLTVLMISRGTPMLLGGDELWRTQQGNNNTYCQDNPLSWHDWSDAAERSEIRDFCRKLVALRRAHPALTRPCFVAPFATDGDQLPGQLSSEFRWHGVTLDRPDWSYHSHSLALQIQGSSPATAPDTDDRELFVALNGWSKPLRFELPALDEELVWHRVIDTSRPSPMDLVEAGQPVDGDSIQLPGRCTVLLVGKPRAHPR